MAKKNCGSSAVISWPQHSAVVNPGWPQVKLATDQEILIKSATKEASGVPEILAKAR